MNNATFVPENTITLPADANARNFFLVVVNPHASTAFMLVLIPE